MTAATNIIVSAYLLDTNLLVRVLDATSPNNALASRVIRDLLAAGADVCVTPQNFIELWAVATRPRAANGLEMDAAEISGEVGLLLSRLRLLEDIPQVFTQWLGLVTTLPIGGKQVHDARLVAVMLTHGITHLLTFNVDDFKNYMGITVVDPRTI